MFVVCPPSGAVRGEVALIGRFYVFGDHIYFIKQGDVMLFSQRYNHTV